MQTVRCRQTINWLQATSYSATIIRFAVSLTITYIYRQDDTKMLYLNTMLHFNDNFKFSSALVVTFEKKLFF